MFESALNEAGAQNQITIYFMVASTRFRPLGLWLVSIAILCLALWLRLRNLYAFPAFVDEANHLLWAQRVGRGIVDYPVFMDGKLLMAIVVSWFQPYTSPLWIARSVIGISALISCAACIGIGQRVDSLATGALAGLLYAVLPFAVFHERQLLADSLMTAPGSLSILLSLQLAHSPRWRLSLFLGVTLALAFLTKFFFGFEYLAYSFFAIVFARAQLKQGRLIRHFLGAGLVAVFLIAGTLILAASQSGHRTTNDLGSGHLGFVACPPILCEGDLAKQITVIQVTLSLFLELIPPYLSWPVAGLAVISLIDWHRPNSKGKAAIGFGLITILIFHLFSTGGLAPGEIFLPPRYLLPLAVPLAVLAASGLLMVWRLGRRFNDPRLVLWQAATALVIVFAIGLLLINTVTIGNDPWQASYPPADTRQYFTENGDGAGFREATLTALACMPECNPPPAIIAEAQYNHFIRANFDRTQIDLVPDNEVTTRQIGQWLLAGQAIFVIDQVARSAPVIRGDYQGLWVEEIQRFGRPGGQQLARLLRVTGTSQDFRHRIFDTATLNPDQITGDYQTLLTILANNPPDLLVVYPPTQARVILPLVAAHSLKLTIAPVGDSWPLEVEAIENQLSSIVANHQIVQVAFLQETGADPQRQIETWLNAHLFRIDEQWFGPIRVVSYAGDGPVAQTIPVRAKFGESILLDSIDVLDRTLSPGGVIRIRLKWRSLSPTNSTFKVFTHLFTRETIIAQHDSQPAGELRPTNTWQPGETIYDQFAIRLPQDAPPQTYQLRVGMYGLVSQTRLSTITADGVIGEFIIGGEIEIK